MPERRPSPGLFSNSAEGWCRHHQRMVNSAKRISWSQYALERLSGFERRPARAGRHNPFNPCADRARVQRIYAELDAQIMHRLTASNPSALVRSPIPAQAESAARHRQLQDALAGVLADEGFLPVAAPSSVIPTARTRYYKTDDDLASWRSPRRSPRSIARSSSRAAGATRRRARR